MLGNSNNWYFYSQIRHSELSEQLLFMILKSETVQNELIITLNKPQVHLFKNILQ